MLTLRLNDAHVLHDAGRNDEAALRYAAILEDEPACEEALYRLGVLLAEQGKFQEAILPIKRLLAINQTDPSILLTLSNLYRCLDRRHDVYATLMLLIQRFPDYAPAYHNLGVYFYKEKQWQQAIDALQQAILKKSDYVDAYYHLGLVYFQVMHVTLAIDCFHAVLQWDRQHVGARFHLACLMLKNQKIEDALSLFTRLHQDYPYHFETIVNLSHCLLLADEPSQAFLMLQQAEALSPDDTQVLFNLGVIAARLQQIETAMAYYHAVLQRAPETVAARYNLALLCVDRGDQVMASMHLQLLLDVAPSFEQAVYLLAALRGDQLIKSPPPIFVTQLFDQYAAYYDAHMVQLQSAAPQKIADCYARYVCPMLQWASVLDLGAGTGRLGELLSSSVDVLEGIDLSLDMLQKARAKGVYTKLYQEEVVHCLQSTLLAQSVDCVVAADCFSYVGDLSDLFQAIARVLKSSRFVIFTIEKAEGDGYCLQPSGRFAHSLQYINALLGNVFEILHVEEIVLRYHGDAPVMGYVYVLQLSS